MNLKKSEEKKKGLTSNSRKPFLNSKSSKSSKKEKRLIETKQMML